MDDGTRIGDQAGIGEWAKALVKLLDVIQSGVGAIWAPHQLKRLARAEVAAQQIRFEGLRTLKELRALPPPGSIAETREAELVPDVEATPLLLTRTKHRTQYQEAKRQLNVEGIALGAFEELRDCPDDHVSDALVDEDWTARFFEYAKDVSTEDMQTLWSKILAGEVKRPGSFSLRCLELVRNLTGAEAHLFQVSLPYVVAERHILHFEPTENPNTALSSMVRLAEAGLCASDLQLMWVPEFSAGSTIWIPVGRDVALRVQASETRRLSVPSYLLTEAGAQLARLLRAKADIKFVHALVKQIATGTCEVHAFRIERQRGQFIAREELKDADVSVAQQAANEPDLDPKS